MAVLVLKRQADLESNASTLVVCTNCFTKKPNNSFRKDRRQCKECESIYWKAYNRKNKAKVNQASKKWAKENIERDKVRQKARHLKENFNLTHQQYDALVKVQNGVCAICKTGQIRGLLCWRDNTLIGRAREDTNILLFAIKYMERHINAQLNEQSKCQ